MVERRRLSYVGHVTVAIVVDARGEVKSDEPQVNLIGVARANATAASWRRPRWMRSWRRWIPCRAAVRRDPDALGEAVRRAVRGAIAARWGKKPLCPVFVSVV